MGKLSPKATSTSEKSIFFWIFLCTPKNFACGPLCIKNMNHLYSNLPKIHCKSYIFLAADRKKKKKEKGKKKKRKKKKKKREEKKKEKRENL